jgi:hypothetical protein|tara:strand:+ start:97 stop:315 length:219 start_codon:yes stop_codon:yes gene_type:complete
MVEIDSLMKGEINSRKLKLIDEVMKIIIEEFDQESLAVINHNIYSIKHTNYGLQHYDIVTYLDQLKHRIENK